MVNRGPNCGSVNAIYAISLCMDGYSQNHNNTSIIISIQNISDIKKKIKPNLFSLIYVYIG